MAPPIVSLSSVLPGYSGFIDPHFPPYNAKGDTVSYADLVTYSGNQIGTPSGHVFTDADVGKLFYSDLGGNPRTITAVDKIDNRITVSGSAITSGQTNKYGLWGTDDTAAIRAALAAAAMNIGGGIPGSASAATKNRNYGKAVRLRSGGNYLVRNTAADFAAGRWAALEIPRRCALVGSGPGPRQTIINVAPDNYGHGIANQTQLAYDDFTTLANLSIFGSKGLTAPNSGDGIHFEFAFNGYDETDQFCNIWNVDVRQFPQSGTYLNGRGEGVFSNIRSIDNSLYGFNITGFMDSTFVACNAGGNSKTGFRISRTPSSRFVGCKSYYNGSTGGTDYADCAGWYIYSDDTKNSVAQYIGCESQESRGSSFVLDGAGRVLLDACMAGDPGRAPIGSGTRPNVCSGFHLRTGLVSAFHNTFSNCRVGPSVALYSANNWGYGTHAVYLEAGVNANHGDIWTDPTIMYSSSLNVSPGSYSSVGGPGATSGLNTLLRVNGVALT